jgi:hypothetical protein
MVGRREMKSNHVSWFFSPDGCYDRICTLIPVDLRFLLGIPVGQVDSVMGSPVGLEPSGIAVRSNFLSAGHQEFLVFPVDLFLTARS